MEESGGVARARFGGGRCPGAGSDALKLDLDLEEAGVLDVASLESRRVRCDVAVRGTWRRRPVVWVAQRMLLVDAWTVVRGAVDAASAQRGPRSRDRER